MDRYGKGSALPLYTPNVPSNKPPPSFNMLRSQFQISGYMVFASFVFWVCMGIFAYKGFLYGTMYMSFNDQLLEEVGCCSNFGGSEQDRINFIEQYNKGEAGPYLMRLGPETYNVEFKGTQSPKELTDIPPVVTAGSSSDFYELQTLISQWVKEIKPAHKDAKLIIYDLGFYSKELDLIKEHCHCEVRVFTTSQYPAHVADFTTFAYRPIIIQTILEEFGSVLWMNPNNLFTRAGDLNLLKYRASRDFFLWEPQTYTGIVAYTNPKMFEYLKEDRCCYTEAGMVDMSALVFYRTNITWIKVMKPWLKCALNKDCIAPPRSVYSGCFEMRSPKTTGCHRYDQSALSIIMERMYSFTFKAEDFASPRISKRQEEYIEHFPEQPWTYTEIFFVTIMPFTCLGGLVYLFLRRRSNIKSTYRRR